jgi:hypothetical protein
MDELERRLAAVELWAIEVGAWLDPEALNDAERSIRAGLHNCSDDEAMVMNGAIGLTEDARKRFRPDFPWHVVSAMR